MNARSFVIAIRGTHAGKMGKVITTHTYPNEEMIVSTRFPHGSDWVLASDLRKATPEESKAAS